MAFAAEDGRVAARLETCGDADDVFVDPKRRRVYVSCGEGVVDVFIIEEAGYRRLARVPTVPGARTSLFVPELDRLFVAGRANSRERPAIWVFRPNPSRRSQGWPDLLQRRCSAAGAVPHGGLLSVRRHRCSGRRDW